MLDSVIPFLIFLGVDFVVLSMLDHGLMKKRVFHSPSRKQFTLYFSFQRIYSCFLLSSSWFISCPSSLTSSSDLPSCMICCYTSIIHLLIWFWSFIICPNSSLLHFLSFFFRSLSFSLKVCMQFLPRCSLFF